MDPTVLLVAVAAAGLWWGGAGVHKGSIYIGHKSATGSKQIVHVLKHGLHPHKDKKK